VAVIDRAGLSTGEEDVAAFVRIGGKEEDEVSVIRVRDELGFFSFF
jgi:hypothetical protein